MNAARQVDARLHVAGDARQQASAEAGAAADALQPAVCFGAVMHERHVQAHNRFIYPTAFLRLPAALGGGSTGVGFSMQFALLGAGHLIGLAVGLTQLFGLILAWLIFVPILTSPEFVAWAAAHGVPSIAASLPA